MSIRVYLHTSNKRAETPALLDSGATENFINLEYARYLRLPTKRLPNPRKVYNVDGTPNKRGDITFYTDLEVRTGERRTNMRFFLTDLGPQKLILGYPWFAAVQPKIDWAKGWIDYSQLPVVLRTSQATQTTFPPQERRIKGRRIKVRQTTTTSPPKRIKIPLRYKRHASVFSEKKSQRFPNKRPWDHAIDLKPDAPTTLPGKVYSLTQAEQLALGEFLKEHLNKGYIRPSKSPYAAPFFFIKKKDGKLRPVQDYRKVNEWSIKNRYPLPLIPELINRVKGASLFSKFDVRWGYNNVRIKEGDEWKAAFITNQGLFEPRVMFFGLTNSPATFQAMMNEIFIEELREGWLSIYMDDILIHTGDDRQEHRGRIHQVLDKLRRHDLFLKPEKCQFEQEQVEFLGVVLRNGTIQMDPAKIDVVAKWPQPRTVRDVRAFLGFTGFYRYFIPNYSKIARPLIDLTKKATPFHWDAPQITAFETLRSLMCKKPILRQPNYDIPFFLATDASAYGVGAVLSQEGETNPRTKNPTQHPIAYYSATFTPTERNYDIYERELLAILKSLEHWRPHVAATKDPVTVLTDHANLTFWKNPKKVNRRVARWFATLQDYNLKLKHVPGKLHAAPDMLSRPPDADKGEEDNQNLTLLPPELFIRLLDEPTEDTWINTEKRIAQEQKKLPHLMKKWAQRHSLTLVTSKTTPNLKTWQTRGRPVIPPNELLKREIVALFHDRPTNGHPGRDQTIQGVTRVFWWPGMNDWIGKFVKGCATCQQNKNITHPRRTPLFRIPADPTAFPFQVVAMDLITQLPKSYGSDAILTIVDHGCTRAAVFLPCSTTITGEGIAQLYLENVYRWFGLPTKVISDRDPRFTSHFAQALCKKLHIHQNISSAFHPQTDGLSERKNQWVEQYLRLISSAQQNEWRNWLPIATAVHNNNINATTKIAPARALLGYLPNLDPLMPPLTQNDRVEERAEQARRCRELAQGALNKVAAQPPQDQYAIGDQVWLEGTNLNLPYQTRKLAPKRYGPFAITKRVSAVAYQLRLPPAWTIHDVFHASLLTPYKETLEHGPNYLRPPPEIIDGEAEFEVEAIMGHRHFGRTRRLQYLIKWKGYPTADNTWEFKEQVFAPKLIKNYHRTHPIDAPFPTKRRTRVRRIPISPPCLMPPEIPPSSPPVPHLPLPLAAQPPRPPSTLTPKTRTPSPPTNATLPDPHSPSSKPSGSGGVVRTSARSLRSSPRLLQHGPARTKRTLPEWERRIIGCDKPRTLPPLPLLAPPISSRITGNSRGSSFPTSALEPEPATSVSVKETSPEQKAPWGGEPQSTAWTSPPTPSSKKGSFLSLSRPGSGSLCTPPTPITQRCSKEVVMNRTGDSPLTSPGTEEPVRSSPPSSSVEMKWTTSSPPPGSLGTSSPPASVPPKPHTASTASATLPTWQELAASTTRTSPVPIPVAQLAPRPVVGVDAERRVMLPPTLRYRFCQFLDPVTAHKGGRCTCFG